MNVFGVGLPEMMVIMAVALLIFGPKKLPEIGRTVAKTIRSLQDASKEFESELRREADQLAQSASQTSAVTAALEGELADTPDAETDFDSGIEADDGTETEANAEQVVETVAAVSDETSLAEEEGEEAYDRDDASVPSPSAESQTPVAAGVETT